MISVVMSVYNEELKWIDESVSSILNQTYSNLEFIIVIDNPRLDAERKAYLEEVSQKDERVCLIYNKFNKGLALSLNVGIAVANGEYIARMDADDISEPDRLEKELIYIQSGYDMVSTDRIIINESSEVVGHPNKLTADPNIYMPYMTLIVHPAVLMKTSVVRKLDGYRNFPRSQDYDLWLRMVSGGYRIGILNEPLLKYRIRTNSLTNNNRLQQYYINVYQKRLYRERKKSGHDSFSEEHLAKYLEKKKITNEKNSKCLIVFELIEEASDSLSRKELWNGIKKISKAFILYPEIVRGVISNKIRKRYLL